jgi:glycosyltransferase involved in cell wall biosynthesis
VSNAQANELVYEVSIVVPIYNGEEYIAAKLESLKGIEGVNHEVIIALNKSTDKSEELIDRYSRNIQNLCVIKHSSYMEVGKNFQSGVKAARGHFIFVSAVDDICDKQFYPEAVKILKERVRNLFHNIRVSHGIFYSLIRRNVATDLYQDFSKEYSFIGGDWLFDLKLALEGEVLRARSSECVFGVKGVSRERNHLSPVGTSYFNAIFPYSNLVAKIIKLTRGQRLSVKVLLFKISLGLLWGNLHRYIFSFTFIRNLWKVVK